jgi:hypothetical protein
MVNFVAKSLVLLHTVLSVAAMSWAILNFWQDKDFGRMEPIKEVLEYKEDGTEKTWVRYASTIDKSQAALIEAKNTRDLTYAYVKPTLDEIRENEAYLANNHLHYRGEIKRLRYGPGDDKGEIEIKRFQDGGLTLDTPTSNLGKPAQEDKPLANIKKSYAAYSADLDKIYDKEKEVLAEIQKDTKMTKALVFTMTGTNELNQYVQPGLYDLIDLEFKAQIQLKIEIDNIKPHWSKAIENARLYQSRRGGLEETLQKLQKKPAPPMPPTPKPEKKVI